MTLPSSVEPLDLRAAYSVNQADVQVLQASANLLLQQAELDLPVEAGLAFKVMTIQKQIKGLARQFDTAIVTSFIELVARGHGFWATWDGALRTRFQPLLPQAVESQRARQVCASAASA